MSLAAGAKLGPYEIQSPLGAGGMGEVYRARDTRLDRTVAIKILPAHLSANPEAKQRFEREAKAISSLSHPNICALYDVGAQDGVDFLVMEYLEGETLADRLKKGALPLDQLLRCGMEIANGLDKAHRSGVVHRDLKPGNIMLTKTGAKLMDFGLAKSATAKNPALSAMTAAINSPAASHPLTAQGTVVGTFQYMSPEQVEGKDADERSDIFALGAVLYEMLTGQRAFEGKSQLSVASAILEKEPAPISSVKPLTPPALDHVIRKCLAKEQDKRWQTAADISSELQWIAETGSQAGAPAVAVERGKKRERLWMSAAALLLLTSLALLAAVILFPRGTPEARVLRSFLLPPEGATFSASSSSGGPAVLSPDGKLLAFVAAVAEGKRMLWVRPLESLTAQPLTGTEDAGLPFWSPDSRSLGFFAQGKLKKIELAGGPALPLCDAVGGGRGGTWSRDGVIVFTPDTNLPLFRVSAGGGSPTQITKVDISRKIGTHRWPRFLPDGRHFLYLVRGAVALGQQGEAEGIYAASLDGKENKLLVRTISSAAYASGHLLFVREGNLMAQLFDPERLELKGDAFPVAEHVQFDPGFSLAAFTVSENGILAYQAGGAIQDSSRLLWIDRTGKELGALGDPAWYFDFRISPDGTKVAANLLDTASRSTNVWIYDVARGLRTRSTFSTTFDRFPVWSPDGSRIVYASNRQGQFDLYMKPSSGVGTEELLLTTGLSLVPTDWSSDGRFLLYHSLGDLKTGTDLWVLPITGDRKPVPFLQTSFNESDGRFSPDGKWVAYVSNESGTDQVYVAPYPGPGGKWQVSNAGGSLPMWRRDGKELFYLSPDDKMMAAEVSAKGSTFEAGAVRPLFQTRPQRPSTVYDPSRGEQRFLVNTSLAQKSSTPVTLVVNWTAELKKK